MRKIGSFFFLLSNTDVEEIYNIIPTFKTKMAPIDEVNSYSLENFAVIIAPVIFSLINEAVSSCSDASWFKLAADHLIHWSGSLTFVNKIFEGTLRSGHPKFHHTSEFIYEDQCCFLKITISR